MILETLVSKVKVWDIFLHSSELQSIHLFCNYITVN